MKKFLLLLSVLCCDGFSCIQAQATETTILLICQNDMLIAIDGEERGLQKASKPVKYAVSPGEHFIQGRNYPDTNSIIMTTTVIVELGSQKIVNLKSDSKKESSTIEESIGASGVEVARINFVTESSIAPTVTRVYPGHKDDGGLAPIYYYAFEAGDIIEIDVAMANAKGTNVLYVSTYPENSVKYSNLAFIELKRVRIQVEKRSIYRFAFASNHIVPRNVTAVIRRIPKDSLDLNFSTNVHWKDTFVVRQVQTPQAFHINSESKLVGKSQTSLQVRLPVNTIEWYYTFAATRDIRSIESTRGSMNLFGELVGLFGIIGKIAQIGIDQLTVPPGADYCNVYLMSPEEFPKFEAGQSFSYFVQGSRKNFMSSVVKITDFNADVYYLGISNPDGRYGINVAVEIVAVCKEGLYSIY